MNIFDSLKVYQTPWQEVNVRPFTQEELASVTEAVVVTSTYGLSVQFTLKSGGITFIPLDRTSTCGCGEILDLTKASIVTFRRGNEEIDRVRV